MKMPLERNPSRIRLLPLLLLLIGLLWAAPAYVDAAKDWMQSCNSCHCNWNSGKKTADCKSRKMTYIPADLSNEMQVVDFSHNQIAELRREVFVDAGLPNLHKILMRNCTLQEVSRDAFKDLAILFEVDLSNNQIGELRAGTFAGLEKLRNVLINNNELEVLENHLFANLPFLMRVEFKNNRLKVVEPNAFVAPLPMLIAVSLESNQLTHLRRETFSHLPKLVMLSLAENRWNCTCDLQDFREFAVAQRLYTPPTSCYDPPHLRGKLWVDVSSDHFACRPRIIGAVRNFYEATAENISIPCRIVANPRPNVTWVHNKRLLNLHDPRLHVINTNMETPDLHLERFVGEKHAHEKHAERSGDVGIGQYLYTSELRIHGVRPSDRGLYVCIAENRAGREESEFQLLVHDAHGNVVDFGRVNDGGPNSSGGQSTPNWWQWACLLLLALILIGGLIWLVYRFCWRNNDNKHYKNSTMMSENELMNSKLDKTRNNSSSSGVIMEMQKSLLTEVNPVVKPPRRSDIEHLDGSGTNTVGINGGNMSIGGGGVGGGGGIIAYDDGHEIKKTLLEETAFGRDDETRSISLSDATTPRSRHTYVDDTYGNSLPPDLLAFPARAAPTSPSMQSSQSNIPDQIIYGLRSPQLTSPVYAHMAAAAAAAGGSHHIYGTTPTNPNGFMTLQHPKSRNMAMLASANMRQQQLQHQLQLQHQHQQQQHQGQHAPFLASPLVYTAPSPAVVMKQGYMTIPRKPRVPSWAPSTSAGITHAMNMAAMAASASAVAAAAAARTQSPTSPNPSDAGTATTAELQAEPVYDNLGLRTTAGGNSVLSLNKSQHNYSMRDRPLPATPSLNSVASTAAMTGSSTATANGTLNRAQPQQKQQQQQSSTSSSSSNGNKIYEPIQELSAASTMTMASDKEPLYGLSTKRQHGTAAIAILPSSSINGAGFGSTSTSPALSSSSTPLASSTLGGVEAASPKPATAKIPPRPPPKPKKKMSVTAVRGGQGSTSQLFDDEGEDGTEV